MAIAYSDHEMETVAKQLKATASKFASTLGMRKTSVDQIVAEVGVSKSIFYKLYETKEHLFLDIVEDWHTEMMAQALSIIHSRTDVPMKERLTLCLLEMVKYVEDHSMIAFLRDDMPYMFRKIPHAMEEHYHGDEVHIQQIMEATGLQFNVPNSLVVAVVHTLVWSVSIREAVGAESQGALELLTRAAIEYAVRDVE